MRKVVCINNDNVEDLLEIGKEYYVEDTGNGRVLTKCNDGRTRWFGEFRFFDSAAYNDTQTGKEVIQEDNKVEHPVHYNKGIECWDYTTSHNMGFLDGNVVKYVTRYRHKNGLEDLLKAKEYLDKLIEVEQNNNN